MADITSANVSYTLTGKRIQAGTGYRQVEATLVWPAGLTYASGGIELDHRKFGFRKSIKALYIMETDATGYKTEYDLSAKKIRLFIQGMVTGASTLIISSSDVGRWGRYITDPAGAQNSLAVASADASTTYYTRALLELASSASLNTATLNVIAQGH